MIQSNHITPQSDTTIDVSFRSDALNEVCKKISGSQSECVSERHVAFANDICWINYLRISEPKIAALADTIDHAVSLAVWGTHGPTVVRLEEPSHPVHIAMRVGSAMAMLETATGRAFAAFLPPKTVTAALESGLDRLGIGYNPKRPLKAKVAEMLDEVRHHGLARAIGDPLPGVNAFAAPVFDHSGRVALVVTAMGPEGTFDAGWDSSIATALRDWAADISQRLGYGAAKAAE